MTFLNYVRSKAQLVGWLIIGGTVTTYFMCASCMQSLPRYALVAFYISLLWIAMWLGNEFISHMLDEKIPWTKQPIKRLSIGIAAVVLYSFSVSYAIAKVFELFFDVNAGGTTHLYVTVVITVVITLVMTSRSFLFNWRQSAIDAEKLQKENIAARYQNMKPEEIIKMQNEMMEMTKLQTEFQQVSSEVENQYNQLESEFREEFGSRLGPIEAEYNKLPDGEGTPQWAIKKGEELTAKYNKEYEAICAKYFTAADAKFKVWLKDFKKFLIEKEMPYTQKMVKAQYGQMGFTLDDSTAELMAVDRYLEKLGTSYSLRKPYP